MKYRICIKSLEDQHITDLIVFAPIEPGTVISWGTDSKFETAQHKVLTCIPVPEYF